MMIYTLIRFRIMKTALRFLVPLFILSLQFYPKIVISSTQDSHYVMHSCEKSNDTYVIGSAFQATLNDTLLSILPAKALQTTFANSTNGTGIDQVNALFYCRGDVDPLECHDCVVAAADKVTKRCQFMKEAVVWYEECTLRYANRSIFSIDEESPLYIYTNKSGIVNDDLLNHLDDEFDSAMDELIKQAASFRNLQGFATTQLNVSSTKVLQCAVQCSPDISGAPCERCLKSAVRQRDKWADTMIFMPSCFIRVDLYNTTRSTTQTTTPPPPPPSPPADDKKAIMIGVISSVCGIFAILVAVCCYIRYWPDSSTGDKPLKVLTYIQLAVATSGFIGLNYLGHGAFGYVYRGFLRGQKVTVKRIKKLKHQNKDTGQLQSILSFINEVNNNFSAVHVNIVKVIGYCLQGNRKLVVYELIGNKSLRDHLHELGNLSWENRKKIALGCAEGLRYLHERNSKIIHRDIKPSNILLDFDYVPKLADFGLARVFPDNVSFAETIVKGTHGYLDPEYLHTNVLTAKSDVYSFGVVLLELITGKKPNPLCNDPEHILWSILQKLPDFELRKSTSKNDSTCHGRKDSTSDGPNNVISDNPNEPPCHGQKDSTSDGPNNVIPDDPNELPCPGQKESTSARPNDSTFHGQKDASFDLEIQVLKCEGSKSLTFEGLEDSDFQSYVDSTLNAKDDVEGMARMIICAAMCVHPTGDFRLCMSQVVQLLEGGSLLANDNDIAYMIENVGPRIEPDQSSSSNTYPASLGLPELKRLATQVLMHKPEPKPKTPKSVRA